MKRLAALLFLVLCAAFTLAAQTPNPADYTMKVHISASHLQGDCDQLGCGTYLHADSTLNGKKLQLSGNVVRVKNIPMLIAPGDYPAKLTKDVHNSNGTLFVQGFDVLLPDNIIWHCATNGVSE
jgi:hypothetical protein